MANSILRNKIRRVAERIDCLEPLEFFGHAFAWQEYPFVTADNRLTLRESLRAGRSEFGQILFAGSSPWRNPERQPSSSLERFFTASDEIRERCSELPPGIDCDLNSCRGVLLFRPHSASLRESITCDDDLKVMPESYDFSADSLPEAVELVKALREIGEVIAMLPRVGSKLFSDDLPHSKKLEPVTTAVMAIVGLVNNGTLPRRHAKKWAAWNCRTLPDGNEIECSVVLTSYSDQDSSSTNFGRLKAELSDVWGATLSLVDLLGGFLDETPRQEAETPKPPAGDDAGAGAKRRGRKQADYATVERESRLVEEWQTAKDSGIYKPDFARDKGFSLQDFNKLLDRVSKRNRRADK